MAKYEILAFAIAAAAYVASAETAIRQNAIECGGLYRGHVQGAVSDSTNIWWSFTSDLVKTDLSGHVLASVDVGWHHGDICVLDGRVYAAVERGHFNASGRSQSAVICYSADTLEKLQEWSLAETIYGAGGITAANGFFYIVGGLPPDGAENLIFQYDKAFHLVKKHVLNTGYTRFGIQTISFVDGKFLLGFYGNKDDPAGTFVCDADFSTFTRCVPDCSNGVFAIGEKRMRVLFRYDKANNLYGARAEPLVLRKFSNQSSSMSIIRKKQ